MASTSRQAHWRMVNDWCEIVAECPRDGRIWEYVVILYGLKGFMRHDLMKAIYGSFESIGRNVEYRCYIGSDKEIKRWGIFQESGDGEMWDDIRFLIDGHAEPII